MLLQFLMLLDLFIKFCFFFSLHFFICSFAPLLFSLLCEEKKKTHRQTGTRIVFHSTVPFHFFIYPKTFVALVLIYGLRFRFKPFNSGHIHYRNESKCNLHTISMYSPVLGIIVWILFNYYYLCGKERTNCIPIPSPLQLNTGNSKWTRSTGKWSGNLELQERNKLYKMERVNIT